MSVSLIDRTSESDLRDFAISQIHHCERPNELAVQALAVSGERNAANIGWSTFQSSS